MASPGDWTTIKAKPRTFHHYREAEALEIQRKLKVDNLAAALRSPEAEELFADGWSFDCVLKPNEPAPPMAAETSYCTIGVENRWLDRVRFCRA